MKIFASIYFASLAICAIAITACAPKTNGPVIGVLIEGTQYEISGHAPFASIEACRASAKEAAAEAVKMGIKLGCAAVEVQ